MFSNVTTIKCQCGEYLTTHESVSYQMVISPKTGRENKKKIVTVELKCLKCKKKY